MSGNYTGTGKPSKELRAKAQSLHVLVRIGKSGLKEEVILEIVKHLKRKKLIKVKFLGAALDSGDKKNMVKELVERTDSVLVSSVGGIVVLAKKGL